MVFLQNFLEVLFPLLFVWHQINYDLNVANENIFPRPCFGTIKGRTLVTIMTQLKLCQKLIVKKQVEGSKEMLWITNGKGNGLTMWDSRLKNNNKFIINLCKTLMNKKEHFQPHNNKICIAKYHLTSRRYQALPRKQNKHCPATRRPAHT